MVSPITSRGGGGGGATTVDSLTDATVTGTPADNELLAFDSGTGEWINQTADEAGLVKDADFAAKGDLLSASAASTPAILPVGANDTVLTADSTQATGLKWAAAAGGLSNVVEDTTPQLGGMLDVNGNALGDGTLEILAFGETASAVNEVTITNAATGGAPAIAATGDDTDVPLQLSAKGTGQVKANPVFIDGDTDEIQLTVQGHSSQTSNLQTWENSSGTDLAAVNGSGQFTHSEQSGSESFGAGATCTATLAVAIGASASAAGGNSVAIGRAASAGSSNVIVIGSSASAAAGQSEAIAIGTSASAKRSCAVFGREATATANNQVIFGSSGSFGGVDYGFYEGYFGGGVTSSAPFAFAFNATGGSGTNIAGANLNLAGGKGTGNAQPGQLENKVSFPGASGTSLQTLATRSITYGPVTLTESSATAICTSIGVATGTVVGGTLYYTIEANDGTDFQAIRGSVPFAAVNKAGTLTTAIGTPVEVNPVSAGTLTVTPTVTTGTNTIILNLNAVSSLTQTVLRATGYVVLDGGTGAWTA